MLSAVSRARARTFTSTLKCPVTSFCGLNSHTPQVTYAVPKLARAASSSAADQSTDPNIEYSSIDGCGAAAHVAYAMSDNTFIYPISPATPMGEYVDGWAAAGRKNVFGRVPDVVQMQSEAGAAGALHGTISAGALSATFTASQGLLLMIPNMYLLAGELQPAVFHVSARALARQALSIFNDHSDVMAVRQTGWALLASHNVQETVDMGLVAHLASLKARVPFLHFFDGLRTSHEIQKIHLPNYEDYKKVMPWDAVDKHRAMGLNSLNPTTRGTGMRPDTYFQASVAADSVFESLPDHVESAMEDVNKLFGRKYEIFGYHGHPEAERVVIVMGSASGATSEVVDYLLDKGERVGVIKPRLFRPWSTKRFMEALPPTAKHIAVLDRTKEDGSLALPLHLDVLATLSEAGDTSRTVVGGSFGLASKEFTPAMAYSVFENLKQATPKNHFVVGIVDDVRNTHLPLGPPIDTTPTHTREAMFWGTGGDGTIGANKTAIKLISDNTPLWAQGFFAYDSKKQGGVTMSHLRFGPEPLLSSTYQITHANYVAIHNPGYVGKLDMLESIRDEGTLVINCPWTVEEMDERFPETLKKQIAEKKLDVYTVDALDLAHTIGLGKRINMIMQAVYFKLAGVLPVEEATQLLLDSIVQMYGKKGDKVVNMNKEAVNRALDGLKKIDIPASWLGVKGIEQTEEMHSSLKRDSSDTQEFVSNIMKPMLQLKGDDLPVSAFVPGNQTGIGTTRYERRVIAKEVPVWIEENCTQCNYCAIACPHAAIRPFLFDKVENKKRPQTLPTLKTKGSPEIGGLHYSIQVAPYGCTGCAVCVAACPDDALVMKELAPILEQMDEEWEYAVAVPPKDELMDRFSVKGSQFQTPLLEFSGACSGCGETPYVKLATQLFGDRMVIANSSGCSSVWGGTFGEIPYTKNKKGRGPAWGRSLFEDTAEYGMGMYLATTRLRQDLLAAVERYIDSDHVTEKVVTMKAPTSSSSTKASSGVAGFSTLAAPAAATPDDLKPMLKKLVKHWFEADECKRMYDDIERQLTALKDVNPLINDIYKLKQYIIPPSHWIIGGDGWAYDIGYGGLDHILASGANVNVLVLDTEMYSNTGGQVSKSTPKGSYAKYAMRGKRQNKKDLGAMAMMYGNVYVASVSLSANMNQTVQALREAESYNGPSLVIAYATCVDWGHTRGTDAMVVQQKEAVESGYWPLYRFDPRRKLANPDESALIMDSAKVRLDMEKFLSAENRFSYLTRVNKDDATKMHKDLAVFTTRRLQMLRDQSMDQQELLDKLKSELGEQVGEKVMILYASETGTAEDLAQSLAFEMKHRQVRVTCKPMNDVDPSELAGQTVLLFAATCGQGEWPVNAREFWKDLNASNMDATALQGTKFAVFGLGDSGYVFFNSVATELDKRLEELGASRMVDTGLADDQADGGLEEAWEEWKPNVYSVVDAAPPSDTLPPDSYMVEVIPAQAAEEKQIEFCDEYVPTDAKLVPLTKAELLTPKNYDRDIRHFEFDISGTGMSYEMGDSLGIWPRNKESDVMEALNHFGLLPDDIIQLEDMTNSKKNPLPKAIQARVLFEQVLDMFGKPKRRFYEMLALLATDEAEKLTLHHLISPEGKADLKQLQSEEYVNHLEVLQMFPKTIPSIGQLLDYVPDIRPRLYSIASATRMRGDDEIHLLIVADEWVSKSGKPKHGLATQYLRNLDSVNTRLVKVACRVNAAAVQYPSDLKVPLILSGLGTGLAPLRAAIEERVAARQQGDETGPMALFFGSRHEKEEFPYADEFKKYHEMGVLTHIHTAFSRDQEQKVYVQDRIEQQADLIYDYLIKQNGNFYYCGTGGSAVDSIQAAVEKAFATKGGMTPEEAHDLVMDMRIKGRYNVESW